MLLRVFFFWGKEDKRYRRKEMKDERITATIEIKKANLYKGKEGENSDIFTQNILHCVYGPHKRYFRIVSPNHPLHSSTISNITSVLFYFQSNFTQQSSLTNYYYILLERIKKISDASIILIF